MKIAGICSIIITAALSLSTADAATSNKGFKTYSLSDFIIQSDGSLINGKLASSVNIKLDGSPFVITPNGYVSFIKQDGSDLAGKTIFVPDLKNCLVIGAIDLPEDTKIPALTVNRLICPNQVFIKSQISQVAHYSPKNISRKINYEFKTNIPAGTKVQIYSSAYRESLCDADQYKAYLLSNLELGQDFKNGFWSGCSGQPVTIPSSDSLSSSNTQTGGDK